MRNGSRCCPPCLAPAADHRGQHTAVVVRHVASVRLALVPQRGACGVPGAGRGHAVVQAERLPAHEVLAGAVRVRACADGVGPGAVEIVRVVAHVEVHVLARRHAARAVFDDQAHVDLVASGLQHAFGHHVVAGEVLVFGLADFDPVDEGFVGVDHGTEMQRRRLSGRVGGQRDRAAQVDHAAESGQSRIGVLQERGQCKRAVAQILGLGFGLPGPQVLIPAVHCGDALLAAGAGHLVVAVGFQVGERLRPRGERLLVHPRFDRRAAERDVEQTDRYAEPCTNHASEEISDAGELVERVGDRTDPAYRFVEVAARTMEVEPDGDLAVAQQRVGFARVFRRVPPAQELHLVFHIRLSRADEHLARVDVMRDHRFVAAVDPHLQPVGAAGFQRTQLYDPGSIVTDHSVGRSIGNGNPHLRTGPSRSLNSQRGT